MGFKTDLSGLNNQQRGDPTKGSSFVSVIPNGYGYALSSQPATIAAALAANALLFAMRLDPSSPRVAYIDRMRVRWTTIAAFTTPVTAGRRLNLFRASGAAAAGGAVINPVSKDTVFSPTSEFLIAQGGDCRASTSTALTATGITFEAEPIATLTYTHAGTAGTYVDNLLEFNPCESGEIVLQPGQLLCLRNSVQAMGAAGTFQLGIDVQWREAPAYGA